MVKMLLDAGADPNLAPVAPRPLAMAVGKGDIHCIEHLLVSGADVNRPDVRGRSALFHLTADGARGALIVKRFLEAGADLEVRPKGGISLRETLATLQNPTIDNVLAEAR